MHIFLRVGLCLFWIQAAMACIPGLQPWTGRLLCACAWLFWAGTFRLAWSGRASAWGILPLVSGLLAIGIPGAESAGLGLAVWGLSRLVADEDEQRECHATLTGLFLFAWFSILMQQSGAIWIAMQASSLRASRHLSELLGDPMTLGFSAAGGWSLCAAVCLLAGWRLVLGSTVRDGLRMGATLALLACTHALWLWGGPALARWLAAQYPQTSFTIQDTVAVLLALQAAALSIGQRGVHGALPAASHRSVHWAMAIAAAALVTTGILPAPDRDAPRRTRVTIWKAMPDWRLPRFGQGCGQQSMGMFGMIEPYLRARGFDVTVSATAPTAAILEKTDILLALAPAQRLPQSEKEALVGFVRNGGGLLVAGDHTDVAGVMEPVNDCTAPFGIRIRFDTALPARVGWENCLELLPHPVTAAIRAEWETALWVGASLECTAPARPLVIGRRGWADGGDRNNTARAFLGDYVRQVGEQLGDLVLVAESRCGAGRVLVFGDSSTMQNAVIPQTHPVVDAAMEWLSRPERMDATERDCYWAVGMGAVAVAGVSLIYRGATAVCLVLLLAGLAGGHAYFRFSLLLPNAVCTAMPIAGRATTMPPSRSNPLQSPPMRLAHIDASHMGGFSQNGSSDDSLFGLSATLARCGYIPLQMRDFSPEPLREASFFFIIASSRTWTPGEAQQLRQYMEDGGIVLLSVGWEERIPSAALLDMLGLGIRSMPLARQTIARGQESISFVELWPIEGARDTDVIWAEYESLPTMLFRPIGRGGCVLVADSQFFHSRNLECYDGKRFTPGNIRYVTRMIQTLSSLQASHAADGVSSSVPVAGPAANGALPGTEVPHVGSGD